MSEPDEIPLPAKLATTLALRESNVKVTQQILASGIQINIEGRLDMLLDKLLGRLTPDNSERIEFEFEWAQYEAQQLREAQSRIRQMILMGQLSNGQSPL